MSNNRPPTRALYLNTTTLRKELHDPKTNRWLRCAIYAELLRRRRQGR